MIGPAILVPAAAGAALAFTAAVRGREPLAAAASRPVALVYLRHAAPQEGTRQQQIKIQHTVKMMLQAYFRGQPQAPRLPPPPLLVSRMVQAVLPRLVTGLGDHVLRHVRRAGPARSSRDPGVDRAFLAGLSFYRPERGAALAFRREGRSAAELQHQVQRITRHVQSKVVHEITQTLPWRAHLHDALRSPEVLRQMTDQLTRAIDRRADVDRYRRGG